MPLGGEIDYKVFIKAKSFKEAQAILKKRLAEQSPPAHAKAIQGFKFHQNYKSTVNVRLGPKEWEQIRMASFPNTHDVLYKI